MYDDPQFWAAWWPQPGIGIARLVLGNLFLYLGGWLFVCRNRPGVGSLGVVLGLMLLLWRGGW